jgi:hypothetical protein
MEIVSGLNRGPVHRLKASIEQAIEKTAKGIDSITFWGSFATISFAGPLPFQDLLQLTSSDHSYATLRKYVI